MMRAHSNIINSHNSLFVGPLNTLGRGRSWTWGLNDVEADLGQLGGWDTIAVDRAAWHAACEEAHALKW